MSAREKVVFESGGEFIRETRREVALYLADARTRRTATLRLVVKTPIAIGLTVASWTLLLVLRPEAAVVVPCLAGLLLGGLLTAFCVQHDANHGATFRSRRLNHLLGWSADALLGMSSYAWRVKHNVAHHTYTNVDGYDDDVSQDPLARFAPSQRPRPWYRFQHYYIWPLYTLMGVRWQTIGDLMAFVRGRVGRNVLRLPRGWELAGLLGGKAVFVCWVLVVPLFFYPWWVVLAVWVGFTMVTSLVMATTFQLAHCVEEARWIPPAACCKSVPACPIPMVRCCRGCLSGFRSRPESRDSWSRSRRRRSPIIRTARWFTWCMTRKPRKARTSTS